MKKVEGRYCPECGNIDNQSNYGKNRSGTQRCKCNECKTTYTLNPKTRAYPEETRHHAIKTYYSGVSGRGVGKLRGFNKSNVYLWIKKLNEVWISEKTNLENYEMDELYWFVEKKATKETRENVYLIAMISREPR